MPYRLRSALPAVLLLLMPLPAASTPSEWRAGFVGSLGTGLPPSLQVAQQAMLEGRLADAVAQARAFLAAGPVPRGAAVGHEMLGTALFLSDQPAEALASLRRAVQIDPGRASAWAKLGGVAQAAGDLDQAQDWLLNALRLDPGQSFARERLAALLAQRGNIAGAIAQYELLLGGSQPMNLTAAAALAGFYNTQQRYADTLRLLEPVGIIRLSDPDARLAYGTALLAGGRPTEALQPLQLAQEQRPADLVTALALAVARRQAGQSEASAAGLRQLLAIRPDWAAAQFHLGLVLIARSDYAGGRRALELAAQKGAAEVAQQQLFVGPLMLGARPNDAVAMFEALAARPGAALADAALLARVYLAADRPADIERAWRGAVARFPKDPVAHWRLVNTLATERKFAEALLAFQAAQREVPDDPRLLLTGSMVQMRLGQTAEALALATRLVAVAPADWVAKLHLAGLQEASGDPIGAAVTYRTVLAIQPDNAMALNNLAALETARDPAGAVALARRALRATRDSADIHDTLGWALLKLGRSVEAVAAMRDAVSLNPTSARQRYRLALAQEAAGQTDQARAMLVEAITAGNFAEIDEARAALRRLSQ